MRLRSGFVLAGILGPTAVLLLILGTRPDGMRANWPVVLAAYAMAHILFWPPAIATSYVARRFRLSLYQAAFVMAGVSAIVSLAAAYTMIHLDPSLDYGWRELVRDTGYFSAASAAAFILYRAVLAWAALAH
jgi:hypothetical protein